MMCPIRCYKDGLKIEKWLIGFYIEGVSITVFTNIDWLNILVPVSLGTYDDAAFSGRVCNPQRPFQRGCGFV